MVYTESRKSNSGLQRVYTDHLESKGLHRVYTEYFGDYTESTQSLYRVYTESIQSLYRVYTEQYRVYTADAGSRESTADNNGKKLEYVNFS